MPSPGSFQVSGLGLASILIRPYAFFLLSLFLSAGKLLFVLVLVIGVSSVRLVPSTWADGYSQLYSVLRDMSMLACVAVIICHVKT